MMRMREGVVLALALAVGAAPLQAQRGRGLGGQAPGPNAGRALDVLVDHQESLGLSESQLDQLQDLKTAMDTEVEPLAEEIRALREQIQAGAVDREEGLRQLQALRGELMTASAPLRGRLQEILTVEQHRKLQAELWQTRPGQGRPGAFSRRGGGRAPGRGLRGSRGGFGLRQGYSGQGRGPAFGFRRAGPGGLVPAVNAPGLGFRRGSRWIPTLQANEEGNLYPGG
jgi:Spy/CpxP family protein refolding chaperone